jgi:phospholipase D1/2
MSLSDTGIKHRTARQLLDKNGEPYPCFATENLWVGYAQRFSDPTSKNAVDIFTTGKAYFGELIQALAAATSEIYIVGWQVNWDAMLAPSVRLFDVLLAAAQRGRNIYVLPWNDNAPVQTFDDQTKKVLLAINTIVGGAKRVHVVLADTQAGKGATFFSHHQKLVVIDRKVAFVGGMDLAYGRYDDASYSLHAEADSRIAMNRYNGCVTPMGRLNESAVVNPNHLDSAALVKKIRAGAYQVPYAEDKKTSPFAPDPIYDTLDTKVQPRMPWQDVQLKITGDAVADLTRNFVYRWNAASSQTRLPVPPASGYAGLGGNHVQVLCSAPAELRAAECKTLPRAMRDNWAPGVQNDIARAMAILIDKAQHFIYIENQFFVSAFGAPGEYIGSKKSGPAEQIYQDAKYAIKATDAVLSDAGGATQNDLCLLLAGRIGRAILDATRPDFHVYITLPVHPEGMLDNGAIMTQVHWTMQSLVFGSMSLLNRIRRFLKARELLDKKDADWGRPLRADNLEYKSVLMKDCFKYVTLLNLRNWEKLGERYVTEQIYVHSKLMVVDDRFALVGSANINDRSLLGSRDSELAVLVMDTEIEKTDLCGDGKMRPTRGVARKLRQEVWKKIFGISGGVRPATELNAVIDKPGDPKTWQKIQAVAAKNTALYEAAFDWIPRNKNERGEPDRNNQFPPASIWPTWNSKIANKDGSHGAKANPMPFDKEFWAMPQHNPAAANLAQVKGYITLLPIEWTKGENNNLGYHTALVTENKVVPTLHPTQNAQVSTDGKQA